MKAKKNKKKSILVESVIKEINGWKHDVLVHGVGGGDKITASGLKKEIADLKKRLNNLEKK
jgi:hypothetical protein